MFCGTCRYWKAKDQKAKAIGLVHMVSNIGICNNYPVMDLLLLIPKDNSINIINQSIIETDETFGCVYYEPYDIVRPVQR